MTEHFDFHRAVSYWQDELAPMEKTQMDQHVQGCLVCQREFEAARQLVVESQQARLTPPPPDLLQRLTAAFQRKQTRQDKRPLRTAALQFDSWSVPVPLGIRGGAPRERQLLYNQEAFDVDVQIGQDAETDTFTVQGQLLEAKQEVMQLTGIEIHLVTTGSAYRHAVTDEFGRFSFSRCPAGKYQLRLLLDDRDLILDSLVVQPF